MAKQIQGYWLFALDCKFLVEKLTSEILNIDIVRYIASNLWSSMTKAEQQIYKDMGLKMHRENKCACAPKLLEMERFINMCEENNVFYIPKNDSHEVFKSKPSDMDMNILTSENNLHDAEASVDTQQHADISVCTSRANETSVDNLQDADTCVDSRGEADDSVASVVYLPEMLGDETDCIRLDSDEEEDEIDLEDEMQEYYELHDCHDMGL